MRKVAEQALGDAVEITLLIALMERQNSNGINGQLTKAGAAKAATVLRNALIARLVTLIARTYSESRKGDRHLRVAVELLKDKATREIFESANGGAERLAAFDAHWAKCRGDHRLPPIKEFRDKYTAHLGEPKDMAPTTYRDLFAFGAETAKAMELLALATGVAVKPIATDPELISSPEAFWAPWRSASGQAASPPVAAKEAQVA